MNYPCSAVVHLDPYSTDLTQKRALRYCTLDRDHEGDHEHEPTGETKPNKEQRGHRRQTEDRAAETNHQKEAVAMSDDTAVQADRFVPGVDEYTSPGETDIDGTVYGGETLKRLNTFTIGDVDEGEKVTAQFHIYNVYHEGEQVHAQRLVIVDDDEHDVWIDGYPLMFEHIGDWLFKQAATLRPGGDAA